MTNSEEKSLPKKIAEDIIAFILEENLHPGDKLFYVFYEKIFARNEP